MFTVSRQSCRVPSSVILSHTSTNWSEKRVSNIATNAAVWFKYFKYIHNFCNATQRNVCLQPTSVMRLKEMCVCKPTSVMRLKEMCVYKPTSVVRLKEMWVYKSTAAVAFRKSVCRRIYHLANRANDSVYLYRYIVT